MYDLSAKEKKELGFNSQLDQIIVACYNILDLITFYTASGKKEARAWTLKKGSSCPEAGGKIHSDFEKKFIKADVILWDKLIEAGNWAKARELGWLKTVGKEYIVLDGDVIEFKI
jgi:ribosome-binding ATPase YchF (GTP1/OBG family)